MSMWRFVGSGLVSLSLATGVLLAQPPADGASSPAAPSLAPTIQVSVMTQNIFYGGDDYDLSDRRLLSRSPTAARRRCTGWRTSST